MYLTCNNELFEINEILSTSNSIKNCLDDNIIIPDKYYHCFSNDYSKILLLDLYDFLQVDEIYINPLALEIGKELEISQKLIPLDAILWRIITQNYPTLILN